MKRIAIISAMICAAATGAQARVSYLDSYDLVIQAHDDCLGAWFDSSREKALEELILHYGTMTRYLTIRDDFRLMDNANEMFNECAHLVYPDSKLFSE